MNVFQGISVRGTVIKTEDNYNSIPGLSHLTDIRQRLTLVSGKATAWGDQSPLGNNLVKRLNANLPFVNNAFIQSSATADYLTSGRKDYKFLNNGSKFGIYIIMMPIMSLAVPSAGTGAFGTAGASSTGLQGSLGTNTSMGRFGYILRGGATSSSRMITNLLNEAHANYSPSGIIYTASFVNFGQTKGITVRYGTKWVELAPFFPTLGEYPQGNNTLFTVCNGADGLTVNLAQLVIYNWGQIPDATVIEYDIRARALQAKDKLEIQQLMI